MTEETKQEKKSFFGQTWVKVTAGVLGGALVLGGTFTSGVAIGSKASPMGFDRGVFMANQGGERTFMGASQIRFETRGQRGHEGRDFQLRSHDHRGNGLGELAQLNEQERLEALNEWLQSIGVEPLQQLPDELSGSSEQLRERIQLEMLNNRLERIGIDPLDELPEDFPAS